MHAHAPQAPKYGRKLFCARRGGPRGGPPAACGALRGGLPRAGGARARDRGTSHAFPTIWGTGGGTGGRARAFGRAQAPPIWNSGGSGRGGAPPRPAAT